MRNKLLLTAAMVCVEMTPFGRVYTHAQAADETDSGGALDTYGISDSAVNVSYDQNGNLQSVKNSLSGSGGQSASSDNFAAQSGASVKGQDDGGERLYGVASGSSTLQLWGQTAGTISGSNNVDLGKNYLRVTDGSASQVYTGSLTGTTTTVNGIPNVLQSGGLDINSPSNPDPADNGINQSASTTPNIVTLSGKDSQSSYGGYTMVRGQGALILQDGAGITSQGVAQIGLSSNDSGTVVVDGTGSHLDLDGSATGDKPASTVGALVVANNDANYGQGDATADAKRDNALIVQNGGEVSARTVTVANRTGPSGTLYVTGSNSSLNVGDRGLTVGAGTGNVVVDRGGVINSAGVISFGDAQRSDKALTFDHDTVQGNLVVGSGGKLVAGDSTAASYQLNPSTGTLSEATNFGRTDGIVQNFGQDNRTDTLIGSNNKSTFSIVDGELANRTDTSSGGAAPLHTNMDIGISGNATFNATDVSSSSAPKDPISGLQDGTGITVGGNISDKTSGQAGNLVKTGTGTLTLLGNNSYTGTTSVQNGTLQLGGAVGASTPSNLYEQRIDAYQFENNSQVQALKSQYGQQVVANVYQAIDNVLKEQGLYSTVTDAQRQNFYQTFFNSSDFQNTLDKSLSTLQTQLENYKTSDAYKEALQESYNNSGKISSSSQVVLGPQGTLNLAWAVDTGTFADVPSKSTMETSRTIANNITGSGQLERYVTDGVANESASVLDRYDSITHLTGNINLTTASGSPDVALLVRKGNLAIDTVDGKTGSLTITGGRSIVVGDDLGGTNNQLLVEGGGTINSDGGMTIGKQAGSSGAVVVRSDSASDPATSSVALQKDLVVGDAGSGTLSIGTKLLGVTQAADGSWNEPSSTEGGTVSTTGNAVIGNQSGSSGAITVGDRLLGYGSAVNSHLDVSGTITVGNQGLGYLNVYRGGEVTANGLSVGGQAGSTVGVGATNGIAGGTLNLGTGGLTIAGDSTGSPTDSSYTVGVTHGGTINNAGVTTIGQAGLLKIGEDGDDWSASQVAQSVQGTLVAGDVTGTDGTTSNGIVNNGTGKLSFALYANGVIQNRAGSDLHISGNPISLYDSYSTLGHHGVFDTNGQSTYVQANLQDYGKTTGTSGATGGLTKDGDGTLYLASHDNSYTGQTEVKKGTLAIATGYGQQSSSNISSSSGVQVESGATLTGYTNTDTSDSGKNYGAAAATEVDGGGTVEANWNNAYGALNIGALGHTGNALTMNGTSGNQSVLSVGVGTTATGGTIDLASGTKGYSRASGVLDTTGTTLSQTTYRQLDSGVINVNGDAALNSATISLKQTGSGSITAGDGYRILTTTGTVSANHDNALTISGDLQDRLFVTPYLVFENQAVDVLMERNSTSFSSLGGTRNERETGAGLDTLERNVSGSSIAKEMTGINSAGEARRAMNSLSGEIHASARTALIQDSYLLEQAVLDRLAGANCDGDDNLSVHGLYDLHDHRKNGACDSHHAVLWGQAFGSMGHNAGDGNAAQLHHQTAGFIMGGDAPIDDHWRVGGMVAYGRSMFNANGGINSSGNSNNISIGAYSGGHWGHLNLRLGGFYSWNLMNTRRQVEVGDYGGRQTSHYRNGTARVFGELGYKMNFQKVEFEPFAGLSYVNQYAGSFREHGAAALYGKADDQGLLFSSFGFRAAHNFQIGNLRMRAHAMAAYRHAFGGIVSSRQERFLEGGGNMNIGGVPLSRDSAAVRAGLTAKVSQRIDLDVSYIGQYGNQSIENGATGSVRIAF